VIKVVEMSEGDLYKSLKRLAEGKFSEKKVLKGPVYLNAVKRETDKIGCCFTPHDQERCSS